MCGWMGRQFGGVAFGTMQDACKRASELQDASLREALQHLPRGAVDHLDRRDAGGAVGRNALSLAGDPRRIASSTMSRRSARVSA